MRRLCFVCLIFLLIGREKESNRDQEREIDRERERERERDRVREKESFNKLIIKTS